MNSKTKTSAGMGISLIGLILASSSLYVAYSYNLKLLAVLPGVIGIIFCLLGISKAFRKNGAKAFSILMFVFSLGFTLISAGWIVIKAQGLDKEILLFDQEDNDDNFDKKNMDELENKMDDIQEKEKKRKPKDKEQQKRKEPRDKTIDDKTNNNELDDENKKEENKKVLDINKLEELRKKQKKTNEEQEKTDDEPKRNRRKTIDKDD